MLQLVENADLGKPLKWTMQYLPKSAAAYHWLKINIEQPGHLGTSESCRCYVDKWPDMTMVACVDFLPMYYVNEYPIFTMFVHPENLQNKADLRQFLEDLYRAVNVQGIGGINPEAVCGDLIPHLEDFFVHAMHMDAPLKKVSLGRGYCLSEEAKSQLRTCTVHEPDGFVFDLLTLSEAPVVNSVWPHRFPGSVKLVERRITDFPTVCLRDKATSKLASFEIVHNISGFMNHLYTFPEFRRKGLATVVEMKLCQILLQQGYEPVKAVVPGNEGGEKITEANKMWVLYCGDIVWQRYGDARMVDAFLSEDRHDTY